MGVKVTGTSPQIGGDKGKAKKKKAGRPSVYSKKVVKELCTRLGNGENLNQICSDSHMPGRATVNEWVIKDKRGFAAKYARARNMGLDWMADNLLDIADDGSNDWIGDTGKVNHENINRSRLRVDARKWYLSKLAPKRYGDKVTLASDEDSPAVPNRISVEFVKPEKSDD